MNKLKSFCNALENSNTYPCYSVRKANYKNVKNQNMKTHHNIIRFPLQEKSTNKVTNL